jgi:hypothetical protein
VRFLNFKFLFVFFLLLSPALKIFAFDATDKFNEKINTIVQSANGRRLTCLLLVGENIVHDRVQEHGELMRYLNHRGFEVTQVVVRQLSDLTQAPETYDLIILSAHGNRFSFDFGIPETYESSIRSLLRIIPLLNQNGALVFSSCGRTYGSPARLGLGQRIRTVMRPNQIVVYGRDVMHMLVPGNDGLRFVHNNMQVPLSVLSGTSEPRETQSLFSNYSFGLRRTAFLIGVSAFYLLTSFPLSDSR